MPAAKPDLEVADLRGVVLDDRYEIGDPLSEGGMGTVYRGQQLALQRPVAIKVVKPGVVKRDVQVQRLVREAQTTAMVKHPNVIEIIDVGVMEPGFVYLVMEQLEGQDLRALLRKERRLPWPRVRAIAMQVVAALKAAHARGVVHRDIKPSNVFMVEQAPGVHDDFVKVLDFGLAKCRAQGGSATLTAAGEVVGTAAYLAPEVARGRAADVRSEVYAVGVLMYKMATGTVPFKGTNPLDVLAKAISNPVPAPRLHNPQLPDEADRIIRRCLAKRADLRPQSMNDLEADLHALGDSAPSLCRHVAPASAPPAGGTQVAPAPLAPSPSTPPRDVDRHLAEDPSDVLEAAMSEVLGVDEVFEDAPGPGHGRPALHLVPDPEPVADPPGPVVRSETAVSPMPHRPRPPAGSAVLGGFAAALPRDARGFAPALPEGAPGVPAFEAGRAPEVTPAPRRRAFAGGLAVLLVAAAVLGGLAWSEAAPSPVESALVAASVVTPEVSDSGGPGVPAAVERAPAFRATPLPEEPQVYAPDTFTPLELRRLEPGIPLAPVLQIAPEPDAEPAPRQRKRPRKRRSSSSPAAPAKPVSRPPPPPPVVPKRKPKGDPSAPWKRAPGPSDHW